MAKSDFRNNDPAQFLAEGFGLHRQGRLDEAEKIYARILKSAPNHADTLQLMAQLKMAQEIGAWSKDLYDNLARIRNAKQQAKDIAEKTPAMAAAAKALTDKLLAIEGDMTQLQGQAGQDSLNFPGRFDNQITALYSSIANLERKAGTAVTERYADLKPQYDQMAERWNSAVATGVKDFNTAATKAGAPTIVIK